MENLKKILIVDDSAVSRKILTGLVKEFTSNIDYAGDGNEAIEKIKTTQYDLMLLDLLMVNMDGFGVLNYIKDNSISLPTAVVSADIQETTKEMCMELGAMAVINKPPKKEDLVRFFSSLMP